MDLQYYGLSCFRFRTKNAILVTDPFSVRDVGLSYPSLEADVIVYTSKGDSSKVKPSSHREENQLDLVNIEDVGEYEIGGVFINSFGNSIFHVISYEDMNICYLGMLKAEISKGMFEDIGDIDYLIVPVGDGKEFVGWKDLKRIINEVDPAVMIPSCYLIKGMKNEWKELKELDEFQKEFGISNPDVESKLKLKHFIETDSKQLNTIILEPKSK